MSIYNAVYLLLYFWLVASVFIIGNLENNLNKEQQLRSRAEAQVKTVAQVVQEGLKDKQRRAILCAK